MASRVLWYKEFIDHAHIQDTDYNYQLYKYLELLYMNDDSISLVCIFKLGRKLVKSNEIEAKIEYKEYVKKQIAEHKLRIEGYERDLIYYEFRLLTADDSSYYKRWIELTKRTIDAEHQRIRNLEWILGLTYYIDSGQNDKD